MIAKGMYKGTSEAPVLFESESAARRGSDLWAKASVSGFCCNQPEDGKFPGRSRKERKMVLSDDFFPGDFYVKKAARW